MPGNKKTMKGGSFGLNPNQIKYNPESVTNNTINELVTKLTRNRSGILEKTLNNQRVRQRFQKFLEILDHKLNDVNIDKQKFQKFYDYFAKVCTKHKDFIDELYSINQKGSHLQELHEQVLKKLQGFKSTPTIENNMAKSQNQFYENKYLSNLGIAKIKELYNNKIPKSNQNIQLKAQVNQILNKKAKKLSEKRALELKAKLVNLSNEEKSQLQKLQLNNIAANMNFMNLRKRNTLPSISATQSA